MPVDSHSGWLRAGCAPRTAAAAARVGASPSWGVSAAMRCVAAWPRRSSACVSLSCQATSVKSTPSSTVTSCTSRSLLASLRPSGPQPCDTAPPMAPPSAAPAPSEMPATARSATTPTAAPMTAPLPRRRPASFIASGLKKSSVQRPSIACSGASSASPWRKPYSASRSSVQRWALSNTVLRRAETRASRRAASANSVADTVRRIAAASTSNPAMRVQAARRRSAASVSRKSATLRSWSRRSRSSVARSSYRSRSAPTKGAAASKRTCTCRP
jgi:hypothetical protein